jgi:hypothetical protein
MRTTDLFNFNRSSKRLNESLHKTFGTRINFETFDTPKLEDARNKLRTQIHTARTASGFNETVENETLTKAQFMHDAIVAELMDRQEHIVDTTQTEGFGSLEDAVSEVLKKFDENMNEVGGYGMPDEDKIVELLKQGDVDGAIEVVWYAYADQDGGELRNMDDYIEDLQNEFEDIAQGGDMDDEGGDTDDAYAMASAGHGSDEDYGDFPEGYDMDQVRKDAEDHLKKSIDKQSDDRIAKLRKGDDDEPFMAQVGRKIIGGVKGAAKGFMGKESVQTELSTNTLKSYQDKAGKDIVNTMTSGDYMTTDKSAKKVMNRMKGSEKADNKIWKRNESINTGDDMRNLREGEIQQASAIVTAKTMVDRVGRWIEELSGMENETLLQLGDSIRDEMGQEQAKAFIEAVAPAIQSALDNLKTTRDTLSTGVRSLASGEQPADMLGAEPEMDGDIGMDMAGPDTMNEPEMDAEEDPFAAAEPGAGGMETTGREQRESIDRQSRLMKILAG